MLIIGLTGSFGTGKTTVARMFAARGAKVLDADKIVHDLLRDKACVKKIARTFGKAVLAGPGIDRVKLAGIVFNAPQKLKALENIIHPLVVAKIKVGLRLLAKSKKYKVVVIEVPLLFESGLHRIVDKVVVVTTGRGVQLARLEKRTRMSRSDLVKRIKQQMPLAKKVCWADFVINNSGTLLQTRKQAQAVWDKFKDVVK